MGRAPLDSLLAGSRLFQKARECKYRIQCNRKALLTATFTKPRFSRLPYKLCTFTFRYAASSSYGHYFRVPRVSTDESFHWTSWKVLAYGICGRTYHSLVRFLLQKQRVRIYRTKQFPCGFVFIIYILRHSSFSGSLFISNHSKMLKFAATRSEVTNKKKHQLIYSKNVC